MADVEQLSRQVKELRNSVGVNFVLVTGILVIVSRIVHAIIVKTGIVITWADLWK